jgi:menaquinone-dependent protoporphyrinogen oxidase
MSDRDEVLVAYGTKRGATAEIAEAVGKTLRRAGLTVDVQPARRVRSLERYRAVVLGSALYAGRWRRDALRLLRRPELRDRDVWLFSSGTVGEDKRDPEQHARASCTDQPAIQREAHKVGTGLQLEFLEDPGTVCFNRPP